MVKSSSKKLALVGEDSLLGRETENVLKQRLPSFSIAGYASSGEGSFAEGDDEGEAVYIEPLTATSLSQCTAIVLAGSSVDGARKVYDLAKPMPVKPLLIDCSGFLENLPEAKVVSAESPGSPGDWLRVVAHPAAEAIALLLLRAGQASPISQCIVQVMEPASERGKVGVTELHQQTSSLLAFKPLEKKVFDAQLSFNLLPQYGEDARIKLADVEQRIERHVASILAAHPRKATPPPPSVRVVQVPVFHGYSLSFWVEFEETVSAKTVGQALASAQIEVRGEEDEAPTSVGTAGMSGLIAGDIRVDRNNPRAVWIWVVGDNLRIVADTAVEIVNSAVQA